MRSLNLSNRRKIRDVLLFPLLAVLLLSAGQAVEPEDRRLVFYHTHTGVQLDILYARDGRHIDSALREIDLFLADFRTGDITPIDPGLLDLLFDLRQSLGSQERYEVISAYRSPKTNDMLRNQSSGVARNSQHLLGKAIDVRLAGTELEDLRDTALSMKRGGVGYYNESNFIHLDTGRVRRW